MDTRRGHRRIFAAEVIQTSGMDCGPAALKCLLEGFGIPVSYGRLREACHTDVDGTSIDTLEEIASDLGLQAEQVIVPLDHVVLGEADVLPALVVVRNPDDTAHFVVAWRQCGTFVQIMDPARGRLWLPIRQYLDWLVVHTTTAPADTWREWAGSDAFLRPLARRLRATGLSRSETHRRMTDAVADPSWLSLAALDASTRMLASLRSADAVTRRDAAPVLAGLLRDLALPGASPIPDHYWSVRPVPHASSRLEQLRIRGVVAVRIRGRRPQTDESAATSAGSSRPDLRPDIGAALAEAHPHPLREVVRALRADGLLAPAMLAIALLVVVAGIVFEAVLFRGLLDATSWLRLPEQGLWAGALLAAFASMLLSVESLLAAVERRAGRHLDARLRVAFLEKIPRLADAYFQSRPISDMLERSHSLQMVRQLPTLGVRCVRVFLELGVTTAALVWLNPHVAGIAILAAVAAAGIPLLGQPVIAERDLRVRTHVGALSRFHLDAVLGRTAIDAHGAATVIERQHDNLLTEWANASLALQRASVVIEGLQMFVGLGLAGWMVIGHLTGDVGGLVLLQLYWMLNLPALGYELALHAREYPSQRSTLLRLLEPLGAPDGRADDAASTLATMRSSAERPGMRVDIRHATVCVSGHTVLTDIDLSVAPGTHVAIVGASGAGKSTLVGLLLGWHRPEGGDVLMDGHPIATALTEVRRDTAWVDPTVRLWNTSLLENLLYGSTETPPLGPILEATGLLPVLAKLPNGLNTPLGDDGALLSAGEAQRVRLARAMVRPTTRLALLDEPFLGLERECRSTLLGQVRRHWSDRTLLYVTHDVAETRQFDRVLVMENGRVAEDGHPHALAAIPSSRYRRLLQAQERVAEQLVTGAEWRHIRLESGQIVHDEVHAFEHTA